MTRRALSVSCATLGCDRAAEVAGLCKRDYQRAWQAAHRDQVRDYQRRYYGWAATREDTCAACGSVFRTYKVGKTCSRCRYLTRERAPAAPRPCVTCGAPTVGTGHPAYCSPACRDIRRPCGVEGCDKTRESSGRSQSRWCSMHRQRLKKYGSLNLPPKPPKPFQWPDVIVRPCLHCGRDFLVLRSRKYCSDVCRKARLFEKEQTRRPAVEKVAGSCAHCGTDFIGHTGKVYCTPRCMNRSARHRRRAREVGAYVEDVYRAKVYARDGYVCQLCRRPVKMAAEVPHPKAPTLDHIIPLAAGGTHEYANVQLAHFICNSRKSDGDAQLRLDMVAV